MFSNFKCHVLKFVRRNLNAYKEIVEKNLWVPFLKTFARQKPLLLAIQYYISTKKTG